MKKEAIAQELARAELKVFELRAQLACTLGAAFDALIKAPDSMGSGVIIQIHALGGREIVAPVMIRDGLSRETRAALCDDLRRSFELATMVSPLMARPQNKES
jgi:hypothetical protein